MKLRIGLALWVCCVAGLARADEVVVGKLPYNDVHITSVEGGDLVFTSGGNEIRKPLDQVAHISWTGHDAFNEAENWIENNFPDKALASYDKALERERGDWEKALVSGRKAYVKKLMDKSKGAVPEAAAPAHSSAAGPASAEASKEVAAKGPAAAPTVAAAKCSMCGGQGSLPCDLCKQTGKKPCPICKNGRLPCPTCGGAWHQKCMLCNGSGNVSSFDGRNNVSSPCSGCGGTGWKFTCPDCGKTDHKGFAICKQCKGTGLFGDCDKCRGVGRLLCMQCAGQEAARPLADSSDPLTSAKAFIAQWRDLAGHPQSNAAVWTSLTSDQRQDEDAKNALRIEDIKKQVMAQSVRWVIPFEEIVPVSDQVLRVRGSSQDGFMVTAYLSAARKDEFAKLKRGDDVCVSGGIEDLRYGRSPADGSRLDLGILLKDANVNSAVAEFFGIPAGGDYTVFLLDGPGSMWKEFNTGRDEVAAVLSRYPQKQAFSILVSGVQVAEYPDPNRDLAIPLPTNNKEAAGMFFKNPKILGKGTLIGDGSAKADGLKKAFDILAKAPGTDKVLFLYLPQALSEPTRLAVILRNLNAQKTVRINAVLSKGKGSETCQVLQKIAEENRGTFICLE